MVMVYNKEIPQCLPGSRYVVPRRDPVRDGDWPSALERRIVSWAAAARAVGAADLPPLHVRAAEGSAGQATGQRPGD